mgnify:CR=1 FL=1|jgi:purine-binding chemotaxis protein CheW
MSDEKQFCSFYLGDQFFGVEVMKVQEILRYHEVTPVPLASNEMSGLIDLRGQIIPAINMRIKLGMSDFPEDKQPMIIVLQHQEGAFGLLIDSIGEVLQVSAGSLECPPDTVDSLTRDLVAGVHKLDGKLMLALDHEKLANFTWAQAA